MEEATMADSPSTHTGLIETQDQLDTVITSFLGAIRENDEGTHSSRVQLSCSEADPLAMLAAEVNNVLESLCGMREETISYQQKLEEQIATIEKQRAAIRELSTPIIEVWVGVLCVPI